jgi:hypothetical protein
MCADTTPQRVPENVPKCIYCYKPLVHLHDNEQCILTDEILTVLILKGYCEYHSWQYIGHSAIFLAQEQINNPL